MSKVDKKDKSGDILDTPFPNIMGSLVMLTKHSKEERNEMLRAEIKKRLEAICCKYEIFFTDINSGFFKYLSLTHPAFQTEAKAGFKQ